MSTVEGIFSLRIVTADFYMEKPKPGLDPCFSDLRSKEIKKLPIIRIFGSNAEGRKCCMHVHGIFPYLYIPYDKKDFESLDKAIYMIASSIDKAINVSLGQGSSGSQHVFKVQLVKGIPFYGYHQKEHQYLKIYMLNPRFIRRTANLLQNGAIMGKIFQPHESHVPYILQFFIDYNLYGMSFLHVPNEVLKFRLKDEDDVIPYPIQKGQILDCNIAIKQSTSELELDIGSGFILNRFQLITKQTSAHTNPGIESIWQDERVRRQKLSKESDEVPPLEIPASQERPNVKPTESEDFYRIGLISKLQQMEVSMDQTVNTTLQTSIVPKPDTSTREKKRTFNLKKLIANAVYPEECSQDDVLTNASFIADHLSNRSVFHTSVKYSESPSAPESDDIFLDDTIVDEELVLSLTQPDVANQTLRGQDLELLDVMQQLEEREGENEIDLDSTLAPLSQNVDLNIPPKTFNSPSMDEETTALDLQEDDSDNECINDFSMVMDDMDELLLKLSQPSQSIGNVPSVEQFDGADDILRTPKKNQQRTVPTTPRTPTTPKRISKIGVSSPRTPNSVAKKYAPLPLIIQSRSLKKNLSEEGKQIAVPTRRHIEDNESIAMTPEVCKPARLNAQTERKFFSLRKKLALTELRRKSVSTEIELMGEDTPISNRKRRKTIDLDKTHITCNLRTPRRKNEKRLKVETVQRSEDDVESSDHHNTPPPPSSDECTTVCSKTDKRATTFKPGAARTTRNFKEVVTPEVQKATSQKNEVISEENPISSIKLTRVSPRVLLKKCSGIKNPPEKTLANGDFLEKEKSIFKRKRGLSLRRLKGTATLSEKKPETDLSSTDHTDKSPSPIKVQPTTRSSAKKLISSKEPDASSGNKIKINPRVLLKRSPIKIKTEKESPTKSTIVSIKQNDIAINPEIELKAGCAEKNSDDLTTKQGPKSECHNSSDASPTKKQLSTKNNVKPAKPAKSKVHSAAHENKISPRVVIKKCPRIKTRLSLRSRKNENNKENARSVEEACSLSLSTMQHASVEKKLSPPKDKTWLRKKLRIRLKRVKTRQKLPPKEAVKVSISPKTPLATKKPYSIIVDKKYEIIPVAGPSHLDRFRIKNLSTPHSRTTPKHSNDDGELSELEDDDPMVHSFYEKSFVVDSPSVFSEAGIPSPMPHIKCNQQVHLPSADDVVIITPHLVPETYEEVVKSCAIYDIPDMVHQQPFYSNYADVTQRKEVGHTVLCIPGRSLNDIEEFQSSISCVEGINEHRRKMMQALGGQFRNDDRIREYLSTEKSVLIAPCKLPPTKQDAKVWLKAREMLKEKSEKDKNFEEDSPIKIRRQKVVMMMEHESGESGDDMDCSMRSLSLTPLTPIAIRKTEATKTECTPLAAPKSQTKSARRKSLHRAKVSLSQKLKDICISNALEKCSGENGTPTIKCSGDEVANSRESSQSNETINSEAVLAELEKSSFVKNLHGSQGSFDTSFGLSIATLNNTFGFKINLENLQQAKSDIEHNFLTTLSLEVFVATRDDLLPDPQFDAIWCIFYAIENSIPSTCTEGVSKVAGFIITADADNKTCPKFNGINSDVEIKVVANELEGLVKLLELCAQWDPDIFVGYEIEMSSWGYVMERAKYLDLNIAPLLSRVPSQKVRDFIDEDRDQLTDLDVETKLCGRILLDVWRLMRSEIALTSYTFENVMYHILHRRCPRHSHKDLSQWFEAPQTRWIVLEYYLERVKGTLELLDQLDLIGRTSEMAKLIGIQFYEVLSRGSQFRVESMMLRIAKPKNLVPLSPSVQQRAHMRAPEYLPLILEPQSRFYPDPVIVLDFQSLYPSMIMAYNYCFSTCLGRVEHLGQSTPFEFGASQLRVSPTLLRKLLDNELVTVSPCGVVYVKREIREGILPRMLSEVLDTRQMVKQSMKLHKSSTALQRILHSRQLGLKLIANVTYGYTAANFSGRMPCVEVGDSVVAKGRETLERAIKLVEANEQWNVRVVYGDTDSLFVHVPGRSREEAFRIGAEIAELVTQDNPQPVKLKLEKVYQPCILQTKKRYVGYMYESPDQEKPVYEAKGIETVRRDGCPAAAKMLEKCLRILFESADVSHVKSYVCRQFTKLLSGKANIQDLIFAKEFRGLNGYKPTACVPALELTRKWIQTDPRKIPRRGERVPFIVTNGPPGLPLIKLVRSPHDVLADEGLKINAIYYITKAIIPPLNRCFLLIGADVNDWFTNLPRKVLFTPALSTANEIIASNASKKSTISQYFSSTNCIIDCGRQTKQGICSVCSVDTTKTIVTLEEKISKLERGYHLTEMICQACCGRSNSTNCASLDCPVLYVLEMKRRELPQIKHLQNILEDRY